jgi:hypothetical protein
VSCLCTDSIRKVALEPPRIGISIESADHLLGNPNLDVVVSRAKFCACYQLLFEGHGVALKSAFIVVPFWLSSFV